MAQRLPLTVHVPITGKVLVRLTGTETLHEVGEFSQEIPVVFTPGLGEVSFQFEEKFWEGAVKNKKDPTLPKAGASAAYDLTKVIAEEALGKYLGDKSYPLGQMADDIAMALRERGLV